MAQFRQHGRRNQNPQVEHRQNVDLPNEDKVIDGRRNCDDNQIGRLSELRLDCPKLPERLAVLLEILRSKVVDLVFLKESIHLHARLKPKQPPQLSGVERLGSVTFQRQAFQRRARQVLPLRFQPLRDVFRKVQRYLYERTLDALSQSPAAHILARFSVAMRGPTFVVFSDRNSY